MKDEYMYQLAKLRESYILEHNDNASQNLKKYFNPDFYTEKQFEIYEPPMLLNVSAEMFESKVKNMNKIFNVSLKLSDTYTEMQILKNRGNAFETFLSCFCIRIADHIIKGNELYYSEAFFEDVRGAQCALFDMQKTIIAPVTLRILTHLWCLYKGYMDKEGLLLYRTRFQADLHQNKSKV